MFRWTVGLTFPASPFFARKEKEKKKKREAGKIFFSPMARS
jgi:hypothetical protein